MNGALCSNRQMRVGVATPKRAVDKQQQHSSQAVIVTGGHGANDICWRLDPDVTEEDLRQSFTQFGEVVSVKIPVGKGCGFVQFDNRKSADDAIQSLNRRVIRRTLSGSLGEEHRISRGICTTYQERREGYCFGPQDGCFNLIEANGDHAVGDIPEVRYKVIKVSCVSKSKEQPTS
ncbi:Nucleotide-binding alpha-beta plait domain protein [Raphanus sativus]|nr:Nucleotide-binding alpha-beta plait domain protein [Raphanus sativus]